jgi:hypothetical protein
MEDVARVISCTKPYDREVYASLAKQEKAEFPDSEWSWLIKQRRQITSGDRLTALKSALNLFGQLQPCLEHFLEVAKGSGDWRSQVMNGVYGLHGLEISDCLVTHYSWNARGVKSHRDAEDTVVSIIHCMRRTQGSGGHLIVHTKGEDVTGDVEVVMKAGDVAFLTHDDLHSVTPMNGGERDTLVWFLKRKMG